MENENLKLYESMAEPPKSALKTINAGRLKGMSDINPQWRYRIMTEKFGICGIGWKYTIDKTWLEQGASGEVVANAQVSVYVRDPSTKEWSDAIVGIGGSKFISNERQGAYTSDEAFKMAVTDAFSVALKFLGVAAAIYEGRWDGSKYSRFIYDSPKEQQPLSPSAQAEQNKAIQEVALKIEAFNDLLTEAQMKKVSEAVDTKNLKYLNDILDWCQRHSEGRTA